MVKEDGDSLLSFTEGGIRFKGSPPQVAGDFSIVGDLNYFSTAYVNGVPLTANLPVGAIIYWSGSPASIPLRWSICDGTGGTPDLSDLFVIGGTSSGSGSGSLGKTTSDGGIHSHTATTNSTGSHTHVFTVSSNGVAHTPANYTTPANSGVNTHTLTGGTESITTNTMPSHNHRPAGGFSGIAYSAVGTLRRFYRSGTRPQVLPNNVGSGNSHIHTVGAQTSHSHTHALTFNSGGLHIHTIENVSSAPNHTHTVTFSDNIEHFHEILDVRPSSYILFAIMKVS